MEEYQEAMKIANIGKKQVLKDQIITAVKENFILLLLDIMQVLNPNVGVFVLFFVLFTGGQKQASRVSKMIQLYTHKVKKFLEQYKELQIEN